MMHHSKLWLLRSTRWQRRMLQSRQRCTKHAWLKRQRCKSHLMHWLWLRRRPHVHLLRRLLQMRRLHDRG